MIERLNIKLNVEYIEKDSEKQNIYRFKCINFIKICGDMNEKN